MSEFKFSCSQCGQHLSADDSWAGNHIQCPNCQASIIIPAMAVAAPPVPPKLSVAAAPPPPIPAPAQAPARAGSATQALPSRQLCVPALLSMILSLSTPVLNAFSRQAGWPVGLLGCVPGVFLGHMALAQLSANRRLMGAPLAWIGLAFGYLCLVVALVAFGIYGFRRYVKNETPESLRRSAYSQPAQRPAPTTAPSRPSSSAANQAPPAPASPPRPADPKVVTNPQTAEIPNAPVSGTVRGGGFKPDSVAITVMGLELKQGKQFFADASITVPLSLQRGEILDGRKIVIAPQARSGATLHLRVARKMPGDSVPSTEFVTSNYALRLEFGERKGNRLPGRIYLELPQSLETRIAGTFEATVTR